MNNIVSQRFIKCHDALKSEGRIRSSRQFALSLDYLPQSLSEILKGRRDVTIELLRKAVEKYHINPVYIYTGEGSMFRSEKADQLKVLTVVTDQYDRERILHVPVPAQAGYAQSLNDPEFIGELPVYDLPDLKFNRGTFRSFDVSGDSMEPTLYEGDKLVCRYLEPDHWVSGIKNEYVYVIVTNSDVLVKRVINELDASKRLLLISDNDFYDSYEVGGEELKEVWQVKWQISPFMASPRNMRSHWRDEMNAMKNTIEQQNEMIRQLNETISRILT